jgi:hypothetical protein
MPQIMPFIWGIIFGMQLLNLQETQVVSLLWGSHCGSNCDLDNSGNDTTDDAIILGHPIQLTRLR